MFSRTVALIGEDNFNKLQNSRVLVAGLGGVGGYILESLVRSGVGCIGLCDFDFIEESNINRQILATSDTIGRSKVLAAKERILSINPNLKIIELFGKVQDINLNPDDWDFVADAIDDVEGKIYLMEMFQGKIISCMGTANKKNPSRFKIANIEKTSGDPLARSIRKKLRENGLSGIPVLYSEEEPIKYCKRPLPVISYMPAIAGMEISAYIIFHLFDKE